MALWKALRINICIERCTEGSQKLRGLNLSSNFLCYPAGGWVGGGEGGDGEEGGGHESLLLLPFGAGTQWKWQAADSRLRLPARERHGVSTAGRLCAPAARGWATHPVTDVSTSCISGTVSVRVLSCRDSERSTLPLWGRVSEGR